MRRKRWIKASLLTMIAVTPLVPRLTVVNAAAPAAADSNSTAQLVKIITSDPFAAKREDAAVQLVNRADSQKQIGEILEDSTNTPAQTAVAKALAKLVSPNPALIGDLARLLGTNADLTEAAAAALASMDFNQHPEIFDYLKKFADDTRNPENSRAKAVWAMGAIVQQPVAEYLIGVLIAPNQSAVISNAAMDALADMTGIASNGNHAGLWQQWWNGIKGKTLAEFRSQVLGTRDQQFKIFKQHDAQLMQAASGYLRANYIALLYVDKNKARDTLLNYLNDRTPEIRDIGLSLITLFSGNTDAFVPEVHKQLLLMISDADDGVRSHVIDVLLTVNDHEALGRLTEQLKVEKNLKIRVEIISALGKLQELTAMTPLLGLLYDPQSEIAIAAAKAIAEMGAKLRQDNPDKANDASAQLSAIIDPNAPVRARDDVRAACTRALAALKNKTEATFKLFRQLVQPGETSQVRQAALLGFQILGDTHADDIVMSQLDDNNDRDVRAAAAAALQTTATPIFTDPIVEKMKNDPYPKVRDALWIALQNLYPKESIDDLTRLAGELTDDPDKRLITLQKLGEALVAAGNQQSVAQNQQDVADALMAVKPQRPVEAIRNLQAALKFWRGAGNTGKDQQGAIVEMLLDDELKAKQWAEATKFAAEQIKIDPVYQETVGKNIKNKIFDLSNTDPNDAKALIDEALKMDPPLDQRYIGQIHQIQDSMNAVKPPG